MSKYGPYPLNNKIMTVEDLANIVVCVQTMPDIAQMKEGGIVHYIGADDGNYVFDHVYKCVKASNVNTWQDITSNGDTIAAASEDGVVKLSGNKCLLSWSTPAKTGTTDQAVDIWSRDVVVRKLGSYPSSPDDGEEVVSSIVFNQYKTTPYKTFQDAMEETVLEEGDDGVLVCDYKYRVFHLTVIGAWSYNNMTIKRYTA